MKPKYTLNEKVRLLDYSTGVGIVCEIIVEPWFLTPMYRVKLNNSRFRWVRERQMAELSPLERLLDEV